MRDLILIATALFFFAIIFFVARPLVFKHLVCTNKIVNVTNCQEASPYCVATLDNGKEIMLESPQVGMSYGCHWE